MIKSLEAKIYQALLLIIFIGVTVLPLILSIVQTDEIKSESERRILTEIPGWPTTLTELNELPGRINRYYSDHFGFREFLTKHYFSIVQLLGNNASLSDVTVGKDGWLFLGSVKVGYGKNGDPIGDVLNLNPFKPNDLKVFADSLVKVRNWLRAQGVEYIYVISPGKHTIYNEKLPDYIAGKNLYSATDQLIDYLTEHTDMEVLDLRRPLLSAKKSNQLYFKTDSHWNHFGANIAQYEIAKKVKQMFPGKIEPDLLTNEDFEMKQLGDRDLARFLKKTKNKEYSPEPVFSNTCDPVKVPATAHPRDIHTMTCDGSRLNALIYRDSYFTALKPYFSRYFGRSTHIWSKISRTTLEQYVELEKPDVVIEQVVDRNFPYRRDPNLEHLE